MKDILSYTFCSIYIYVHIVVVMCTDGSSAEQCAIVAMADKGNEIKLRFTLKHDLILALY